MSYFGYKSYENELIKDILEKSNKTPLELIKRFSPINEEEIETISLISSCELFFSEEAYIYKIYWGLLVYYLSKNIKIESKWLKIGLLIYCHLEKEIIEDDFLNKNWLSIHRRKVELENEKNIIIKELKNNESNNLTHVNIKII